MNERSKLKIVQHLNAMNILRVLITGALIFCTWMVEAQEELKSEIEYQKLKSRATSSNFYPDGNSGQLELLIMCIDRGDKDTLDKLLTAVPNFVNVTEHGSRCSPIHWAAFKGNTNILGVLLKHGADIKKKGTNWEISALHIAHDANTVNFLLDHGADLEACDVHRQTPLIWAAKLGKIEIARELIRRGAKMKAKDDSGWTPMEMAQVYGQTNMVSLFAAKGMALSKRAKDDFPYEAIAGNFSGAGREHPFAESTLINGGPVTRIPIEIEQ